jgi:hypothetical protein
MRGAAVKRRGHKPDRAAAIVVEIAERLRVPQRVATLAGAPRNHPKNQRLDRNTRGRS